MADVYSTSAFYPSQTGMASTSGHCVTSVQFLCNLQVYLGKEGESPEQQQGARVVSDLATLVYGSARNITTDNFFTSHALAKFLFGQNLTLLGTVRKMRKELPGEFVYTEEAHSVRVSLRFHGGHHISYTPKTNKSIVELAQTTPNLRPRPEARG